ncbi:DUF6929 family protein [Daejeonella sp.]|uniref:DUF6929 family protein n=1 Tax=Daejeonella sp. TaxID=2805397 RepID=UPI003982E687
MKKLNAILIIFSNFLFACNMSDFNPVYESSKVANSYPSGSTISYLNDKFYVMGDDSSEILVLNHNMEETGRIQVFSKGEQLRLPKDSKADIESSVVIDSDGIPALLFLGSGSLSPHRDSSFLLDPVLEKVVRIDTKTFFDELRLEIKDLNIEAAAVLDGKLLLGLRANTTYPDNSIAIAERNKQSFSLKRRVHIEISLKNAGISGMDYDKEEDILFLTFSSEDTSNAYDDGQVGESYLAFLPNAREGMKHQKLQVSNIVKLSSLSPEFLHQKIESVSLMKEHRKLMLVADDDKGNTKIFKVSY